MKKIIMLLTAFVPAVLLNFAAAVLLPGIFGERTTGILPVMLTVVAVGTLVPMAVVMWRKTGKNRHEKPGAGKKDQE